MRTFPIWMLASTARVASAEPSELWSIPEPQGATVRLSLEADLSRHRVLAPVSVAPDLVLGTSARTALTLHYSRASQARLGAGNGLCLRGPRETLEDRTPDCVESETGLGVGGLVELGPAVLRGGLISRGPGAVAAELGAALTWRRGRAFALAAPTVVVAVSGRAHGNRERVQLAAYAGLHAGRFELHARSGVEAALATFDETFAVPLGAGASLRLARARVGIDVTFDRALGPLNGMHERSASAFVATSLGGAS